MAVQTIHKPKENAVNIIVEPGQTIAFDFDLSAANFERAGNDLSITLDDGGQVVLDNFFVSEGSTGLPPLQLSDGTQVNSSDFLSAFDVDVTPAAGAAPGGGLNSYADDAGSLIGGLDLSGSLGGVQWVSATAAGEVYNGIDAPGVVGTPPGTPPAAPGIYLAVLYEQSPGQYASSSRPAFNINLPGASAGDTLNVTSSENGYVSSGTLTYADGKWTLSVSRDGLAAMQSSADTLYDNIVVEYNGVEYNIRVVLTQDGNFTSSAEGQDFVSEWYTDGNVAGRIDEVNYLGGDGSPGEVWLKGLNAMYGKSNIFQTYENAADAGSATIHVGSSVIASGAGSSNTLTTGLDAASSIDVIGNVKVANGAENTLTSGNISVTANSDEGPVMTVGGINTLDAAFDVSLDSSKTGTSDHAYGVSANNGASVAQNIINAGESISIDVRAAGQDADAVGLRADGVDAENQLSAGLTVTIIADSAAGDSFAMYAANNGLNVITLTGGADGVTDGEVNLTGDIYVDPVTGGQNIINGSAGNDVITLNGAMSGADALIIHGGDGTDKLVLIAADSTEFLANYGDWLAGDTITGIESIDVQLGTGMTSDDYDAISALLGSLGYTDVNYYFDGFSFSDGTILASLGTDYISGGLGEQSVNIDGLDAGAGQDIALSALADSINGFEQINLGGGADNMLTIDSLLNGLNIDTRLDAGNLSGDDITGLLDGTALRITGDAGDSVSLGGGWSSTSAGTVTYEGQSYDVYTNSSDDSQFLLIQSGLGIV